MHGNRASADPASQACEAGGQSHLLDVTKARCPAADDCSAPAIEAEMRTEGKQDTRRRGEGGTVRGEEGLAFIPSIPLVTWPQHVG